MKNSTQNSGKNGNSSQPLKNTEIRKDTEEWHVWSAVEFHIHGSFALAFATISYYLLRRLLVSYNLKEWICQFFLISLPKYLGKSTGHYKPATIVTTKIHENADFEIMGETGLDTCKWDPNFWSKGFFLILLQIFNKDKK